MKTKVTTDWHCGVKRAGGTTPVSAAELQRYIVESLDAALDTQHDHLIAGDMLDQFTVDAATIVQVFFVLADFLKSGRELAVIRGNHDYHPRNTQVSSFDLLMTMLEAQFPKQLTVAREVTAWKQFILVPHLPNNDLLKIEVEKLTGVTDRVIVFHANFDNFHAAESQHSLNLAPEMVEPLIANGNKLLLGHEHDHRVLYGGNLVVLGNGVPSSIADCIKSGYKFAAMFDGLDCELEPMLKVSDVFCEIDWRDLASTPDRKFIRVKGSATADEAAAVVEAIARFRQQSPALVIANSVCVDGVAGFDQLAEMSLESITSFNVLDALLEELTEDEGRVIKELLA